MKKLIIVIFIFLFFVIGFRTVKYVYASQDLNYRQVFIFHDNYKKELDDVVGRLVSPLIIFSIIFSSMIFDVFKRKLSRQNKKHIPGSRQNQIKEDKNKKTNELLVKRISIIVVILFVIVWLILWYPAHFSMYFSLEKKYKEISEIYNSKKYHKIKGDVEVESMQPITGHSGGDQILINGVPFEIDYFICNVVSYHTSIAHGGYLKSGQNVLVYYVKRKNGFNKIENDIIALYVKK